MLSARDSGEPGRCDVGRCFHHFPHLGFTDGSTLASTSHLTHRSLLISAFKRQSLEKPCSSPPHHPARWSCLLCPVLYQPLLALLFWGLVISLTLQHLLPLAPPRHSDPPWLPVMPPPPPLGSFHWVSVCAFPGSHGQSCMDSSGSAVL